MDPFGLSADNKENNKDSNLIWDIFAWMIINAEKRQSVYSSVMRGILDTLLIFKDIFSVSDETNISFPIGPYTIASFSTSLSIGDGNINFSDVLSDQIDILLTHSFDPLNMDVTFGFDGSVEIKYSADINKYNTLSSFFTFMPNATLAVGYEITTNDEYDNSLSTRLSLASNGNDHRLGAPVKVPVLINVPEKSYASSQAINQEKAIAVAAMAALLAIPDKVATPVPAANAPRFQNWGPDVTGFSGQNMFSGAQQKLNKLISDINGLVDNSRRQDLAAQVR